jgi:hypothetical protein
MVQIQFKRGSFLKVTVLDLTPKWLFLEVKESYIYFTLLTLKGYWFSIASWVVHFNPFLGSEVELKQDRYGPVSRLL